MLPSTVRLYHKSVITPHIESIIANTGLGGLTQMNQTNLRRIMLVILAKSYNSSTRSIMLGKSGRSIPITAQDVSNILSLPIEGENISEKLTGKPGPNLFSSY